MPSLIAPIVVVVLVAVLIVTAVVLFRLFGQSRRGNAGVHPYEAVPEFLSPAERSFFGVLQQAVASEYLVFAKVRLADIVRPVRNPSRSGWQSAFNRITGKHVDFVLCEAAGLRVVLVVELDDRTHEKFERSLRDGLVDSALASARIPVLRVPARRAYSLAQIREQVRSLLVPDVAKQNQQIA